MSRLGVTALCAAALLGGFVAGRVTGSGSPRTTTVHETVARSVVVPARYVGSASDPRDGGPLDLARVQAVRDGAVLRTTIATHDAWRDSLLRRGHATLAVLYDTNGDGRADRRDEVFLSRGRLTSWISSLGQGVQAAAVTRRGPTAITVARDASVFFSAPGEAGRLATAAIGVAVVARWPGGGDRLPAHGWILVPPAAGAPPTSTPGLTTPAAPPPATTRAAAPCSPAAQTRALAKLRADVAALRRAARKPTKDTLAGSPEVSRLTDRFLLDVGTAPLDNLVRNRLIDRAAAALVGSCQQCFQALEASRPIPAIAHGDRGSCSG